MMGEGNGNLRFAIFLLTIGERHAEDDYKRVDS